VANLPDFNQLYEAYKRGDPAGDSVQLHYLRQIPDLSRSEFIRLSVEIETIAVRDENVRAGKASLDDLAQASPSIEQEVAQKPFQPTRSDTGVPVKFEDSLQELFYKIGSERAKNPSATSDEVKSLIDQVTKRTGLSYGDVLRQAKSVYQSTGDQIESGKGFDSIPVRMERSFVPTVVPDASRSQASEDPVKDTLDLSDVTRWAIDRPDQKGSVQDLREPITLPVESARPTQPIQTTSGDMLQASESEPMQTPPVEPVSRGTRFLDWMQRGADALGVIDQTGVTDLANSTVSFTRAAFSRDDNQQREHLINAGVSMVSAIPIVGDAAKLWKYNRLAKQSAAAGGGVNAIGEPVAANGQVQPPAALAGGMGGGGNVPPVTPAAASLSPGYGQSDGNNGGFFARLFGGGNSQQPQAAGGGFFGNNISQLFGGNAAQGGSGYFAAGGGFFGGGAGVNAPGAAAASQIPNRVMNAVNQGVQGIAGGAAALGMTIPGLQPFAAALGAGTAALNQFNAGIEAVDRTNQAIIEGNRELAQLSGGLAGSYVNYDARTFQRDIQRSEEMEAVLPELMRGQADFADAQQDLYGPFAQAGVVIQTQVTSAATTLIKILDWLEPFGEMIQRWVDDNKPANVPLKARNGFEQAMNDFVFGNMNQALANPPPLPLQPNAPNPNFQQPRGPKKIPLPPRAG
jgi:hypothetical protein